MNEEPSSSAEVPSAVLSKLLVSIVLFCVIIFAAPMVFKMTHGMLAEMAATRNGESTQPLTETLDALKTDRLSNPDSQITVERLRELGAPQRLAIAETPSQASRADTTYLVPGGAGSERVMILHRDADGQLDVLAATSPNDPEPVIREDVDVQALQAPAER